MAGDVGHIEPIGIIGAGDLGSAIASAMLRSGSPVVVYDVRAEPLAALIEDGAIAAESIAEILQRTRIVDIVVPYDKQLREVVHVILETARQGTILVVHSTVLPNTVVELAAEADKRGVALVDAPVSGGAEKARMGALTVMAGGDAAAIAQCRRALDLVGTNVFHVGPVGAGQVMKLVNNAFSLGGYAFALEAMQLARAHGIDEDTATDVMVVSQGDSKHVRTWGRMDRLRSTHTLAGTPAVYEHFSYVLRDAAIAGAQRGRILPLFGLIAQLMPTKLRERDDQLAQVTTGPPIPRCAVCVHELASAYRGAGTHPECRRDVSAMDTPSTPVPLPVAGTANVADGQPTIGMIGVGDMGGAIARCLLRAGIAPVVHDLRTEAVDPLVQRGAAAASSIAEVVERCGIVSIVVTNDEQLRNVVREVLESARPGLIVVVHSTVLPVTVVELAGECAAQDVDLVDAPVSGGNEKADLGALTVMVGGTDAAVSVCRPMFEVMGGYVFHLGPPGAGQAMKLANNSLSNGIYALLLEGMQLAESYGIDEDTVTTIATVSQGDSRHLRTWGRMDRLRRTHTLAGTPEVYEHMARDFAIAAGAGARHELNLPLFAALSELSPRKAAARDRQLAAGPERGPIPKCPGCGHELAAPFRIIGTHPECRL